MLVQLQIVWVHRLFQHGFKQDILYSIYTGCLYGCFGGMIKLFQTNTGPQSPPLPSPPSSRRRNKGKTKKEGAQGEKKNKNNNRNNNNITNNFETIQSFQSSQWQATIMSFCTVSQLSMIDLQHGGSDRTWCKRCH